MIGTGNADVAGAVATAQQDGRASAMRRAHSTLPSPEIDLLIQCARPRLEPEHAERIQELLQTELDWPAVLRLAEWHRMVPLLYWHLNTVGAAGMPAEALGTLRDRFVENAGQSLKLTGELLAILAMLEAEGIPAVPYKGPTLAVQLYGNLALRHSGDLDILVRRKDVFRARDLLHSRGYRQRHPISPGAAAFMLENRYSETLALPGTATVELHWAFTNGDVAFPLRLDELFPRMHQLAVGGGSVPAFAAGDLLLILCVHGAKHCWTRLEWLCGLAELVRNSPDVDWSALLERARNLRSRRRLLLGLLLARDVVGISLHEDVLQAIRRDDPLIRLAANVRQDLLEIQGRAVGFERAASLPHDVFHLRLSDTTGDRLRLLAYRATTPNQPESWTAISVGTHSVPVHALLRPVQVGIRLIPAVWWYLTQRHGPR